MIPAMSDTELNALMAVAVSDSPEFAEAGEKLLAKSKALATAGADSGGFAESLELTRGRGAKGVRDILVTSNHPAALAIEFGHWAGDKDAGTGRHVPGQHALKRAARSISRAQPKPRAGGTA